MHGALHVEQTAVTECKEFGDRKLCYMMGCAGISWSPTLADYSDVVEPCNAATQHLVQRIRGTHKGDLEWGMLNQTPTLSITCSNWYQVHAQVDQATSHFITIGRDNIAEQYDLHCFQSVAECLEFIYFLLPDNGYLFPVVERVEDGVHSPNPTQSESKADNEWLASTSLPGRSNPAVFRHHILSSGE